MQKRRGRYRNYDSAWLSYVRKACCCTARHVSIDTASSQSNQRGFRNLQGGKTDDGVKQIAVSGQIS
jgi:hypothetical protein